MTEMSSGTRDWLSLSQASRVLGVHPTTLRRWVDSGSIPHFRTPGGHRRFKRSELGAWTRSTVPTLALGPQTLVQSAVGLTRQEMAESQISHEAWFLAFQREDERQEMRDSGRRLFGLAIQYLSRTRNLDPILREGQCIGTFYGKECAQRGISLVDTVRALTFFRRSLLRAIDSGPVVAGQYDDEQIRIHQRLDYFLDQVLYACLASYEKICRHSEHMELKP